MSWHKDATKEDAHIIYRWEYADEATRLAATGFVAADVGVLARQLSPGNSLFMLTNHSPVTWEDMTTMVSGGGGGVSNHSGLTELDYASSGHTGFQPAGDYVTETEFTATSGVLQTNIDNVPTHDELHTISSHTDTTASGSQLDELVGGGNTNLHTHSVASGTTPPSEPTPGEPWYNPTTGIPYYWDHVREKWLSASKINFMYATSNGGDNEYMAVQDIQDNNVGYYMFDDMTITGIYCRSVSGDTTVTFTVQDEADSDATITTFAYTGTTLYLSTSVDVDVDSGVIMKVLLGNAGPDLQDTLLQISVAQRYTP